ncbi:cytochrome c biogenesis protein ResB [Corynebacterium choanae]|uniref:Cytochrome c biogenesis protein CcsB n=1 Tax=Corynebacterium choanae TaxID=1862358 RepID=A0A3G6JBJ5_9CORY|nr:cytochrome c biogenesis protein ResB [Corynebacterium choanae]AZA14468.1 Cytochrome c biogenesis protein CcsB [Corynebacterium choanae]
MNKVSHFSGRAWRWLTSMRTALMLLFLLAVGAIPGVLLPQRNVNETKVADYIAANGRLGEVYDRLQLFDVFGSTWFTAIYVLLFFSLIGCIIPRTVQAWQAYQQPPVRAPKNLSRLPHYQQGTIDADLAAAQDEVRHLFAKWRTASYTPAEDRAGQWSFAAEKGFLREVANLVFHLGLVGVLVGVCLGKLVSYEGQVIVIADKDNPTSQFCNTAFANFDDYRWGALVDGTNLDTFCVQVDSFTAEYHATGQADDFRAEVRYATGDAVFSDITTWQPYLLRVNHPLRIDGNRVYLQGHGFAPTFTVTWPDGETRTQTVQFRPDDLTYFLSSGVQRFDPPAGMYPDLYDRRQHQLAIQGLFAPTAAFTGDEGNILLSSFPALRNPAVAVDIYRGDTGLDTGRGQSIFALDMGQVHSGALQKIQRVNLLAGEEVTLDDGTTIRFNGAKEFVNLQISHDPTEIWVLIATLITLAGLVGSLSIKRRRIWVRLTPGTDGTTIVTMGGMARTDRAGWGSEFTQAAHRLLRIEDDE